MSYLRQRNTRLDRKRRIRSRVKGSLERPRASVWRSNRGITVQLIDDNNSQTLLAVDAKAIKKKGLRKGEMAVAVGLKVAEEAKIKNIKRVVFDRGGYKYHGRIKKLAEAMREGGLDF